MSLKSLGRALGATAALWIAAPVQAEMLEAKSAHFTVIGDMSQAELRKRTLDLEQYDAMLRYLLGAKETIPVTVYEVNGLTAVQQAMGTKMRDIAGFYSATAQGANAVVPEKLAFDVEDFTPRVILFHEYAHHMLLSNTNAFMPGWAQEGLAEMFATAKLNPNGSVTIGDKNDARGAEMFGAHRWSIERMLQSDFTPPNREEMGEKYSRGWALVHYLWMSGERPNQYTQFIAELNRTVDPVGSGKKVFGDLKKLDGEIDHYLNVHRYKLATFSADQIKQDKDVTIRPLSAGERALLPFRLASTLGVDQKTAGPLADRARPVAAAYPNDAKVQTWLAEMEYDAKHDAASDAAADRALAADPRSLFGMIYKGRVAMRQALASNNDPAKVKQARDWFRKAAVSNQNAPLPFVLYYDSFIAAGQTPPADAVAGLYRAVLLVPQDPSVRVRATVALLREGQVKRARLILAPAAFVAEGSGENPMLKLIREMDKTQDPKVLLAKAAELKLDKLSDWYEPPKDEKKTEKGS